MRKQTPRSALVVVDMQNDFVRAGAPMEVPQAREIVPRLAGLIAHFRAANLPVIYTRYVANSGYDPLRDHLDWLRLIEPPILACHPGVSRSYDDCTGPRDAAAVIDELAPNHGEAIIDKPYFSAFFGTGLHTLLRREAVDTLYVTGTITEMCVEDTARHAVHHGYRTSLVSDAVASNTPEHQSATLDAFARNYGPVLAANEAARRLSQCRTRMARA